MVAPKYDWPSLDPKIDDMIARGLRPTAIAAELDLRVQTIRDRLAYRRRPKSPRPREAPALQVQIKRPCLTCRKVFVSDSRTRFMCPPCRHGAAALSAHSIAQSGGRRPGHR